MQTKAEKLLLEEDIKYVRKNRPNMEYIESLEKKIEFYLKREPHDEDMWIKYALFEAGMPLKDTSKAVEILGGLINYNPNNVKAMLIMADLQSLDLGGVDNKLFEKLTQAKVENKEDTAMIALVISWFYSQKDNEYNEEKWLKKSILLGPKLSYNFILLGKLYFEKGDEEKGKHYMKIGLNNITNQSIDHLNEVDKYINEFIKGLNRTAEYIDYIKEEYGIAN